MGLACSGKIVVIASANATLRCRLQASLASMRWQVYEAKGGAEAMAYLGERSTEALLVDAWLPDLEVSAFSEIIGELYPHVDILRFDGNAVSKEFRSSWRHELLQALRESHQQHFVSASEVSRPEALSLFGKENQSRQGSVLGQTRPEGALNYEQNRMLNGPSSEVTAIASLIPGMVGQSASMRELITMIQLVAPHAARVLIEGETGTGKELVAKAVHTLSKRAKKPFIVLNCAAIPEALLEAELFGHTRGAFTGAVQSRVGRIEAAHSGTLFLDEIGEMPMALQSKLLRFLENGELQRVGDNESTRVDVRVISATHRNLDTCVTAGSFRLDLLHRLSVFPIEVPRLADRLEDLPLLAEHFLSELGKEMPKKRLAPDALKALHLHTWPGNIRELGHVLQRAAILAGPRLQITSAEIKVRSFQRG